MAHRDRWYQKVKAGGLPQNTSYTNVDKALLEKVRAILPSTGSIAFLRENNFAGFSFLLNKLDDLQNFDAATVDPAFEFLDPDLEAELTEVKQAIREFLTFLSFNTFPTHTEGRYTVPQEWELQCPEKFFEVVEQIHTSAESVVSSYDSLVRAARRRLAVE